MLGVKGSPFMAVFKAGCIMNDYFWKPDLPSNFWYEFFLLISNKTAICNLPYGGKEDTGGCRVEGIF